MTAEAVAKAAFERRCEELRGRIADARTSQRALYEGVFLLTNAGKNQEAYDRVSAGLTVFARRPRGYRPPWPA